jgi:hypothetical protein
MQIVLDRGRMLDVNDLITLTGWAGGRGDGRQPDGPRQYRRGSTDWTRLERLLPDPAI